MTDLIHRPFSPRSSIEPVRAINNPPGLLTDIPIGMDHPLGHYHNARVILSSHNHLPAPVASRIGTIIPKRLLKDRGTHKKKIVGLVHVLVKTPDHTRKGLGDIAHNGLDQRI